MAWFCKLIYRTALVYLLFYCQKSGNKPDLYYKCYSKTVSLPFTFLRQSSIPPVSYRTLGVSTTAAAPTILLLVILGNQGWLGRLLWRHLIAKPSTSRFIRYKDFGDICCTSRSIAHFVSNFVAMATRGATRVNHGRSWLTPFNRPTPKIC